MTSAFDEGEQIRIDDIGMRGCHVVRILFVDLERAVLQKLARKQSRGPRSVRSVSSPCITSVSTSVTFRSSVKSVSEKALMPSYCAFAPSIIPWRQPRLQRENTVKM